MLVNFLQLQVPQKMPSSWSKQHFMTSTRKNTLKSPIFSTFDPLEVVLNEDELKDICKQLNFTHLQ